MGFGGRLDYLGWRLSPDDTYPNVDYRAIQETVTSARLRQNSRLIKS